MKETTVKQMTAEAIEARRAYKRNWYAKNKKHVEEYNAAYWERKAEESRENGKDKV